MSAAIPLVLENADLSDVPHSAAEHFKLALFGIVARIADACADGDVDASLDLYPFLADYVAEIDARTSAGASLPSRWQTALTAWERDAAAALVHLPLRSLRRAGVSALEIELLLAAGLIEEDPRFGSIFGDAQRSERRPTVGLLTAWWRSDAAGDDRADDVRRSLQSLVDDGLLHVANPDAPRPDWSVSLPLAVLDAMRGEAPSLRWLTFVPAKTLPRLGHLIIPDAVRTTCATLPSILTRKPAPLLLVRGPIHNGRKTLAGGVARELEKSLLIASDAVFEDAARWGLFGALAAMADAMPVVALDLAPGDHRTVPDLPFADTPLTIVTGRFGAWSAGDARPTLTVELPIPSANERLAHWRHGLPTQAAGDETRAQLAAQWRLSSGNIRRVASTAAGIAALDGRIAVNASDVQRACRTLQAGRLETLAAHLPAHGSLDDLSVDDSTRTDIDALVARCRFREQLAATNAAIQQGRAGVRALFAGASGTGKTMAARLIAASLQKDVYRVDLAAAVSKYIGETEKNLDQAFSAAEELDVVLLLDEGDALMANRTDVGSSNDRYANLETNYLLQRIESFDGILLITSNAPDRIDRAFARRMDVVINFRQPDEWRRYEILKLHLAPDVLDDDWIQEIACRCALSGGQLRNVASEARLLALRDGGGIGRQHLFAALTREYRKRGASCPLRPADMHS